METLIGDEFAAETTYLNTAAHGLLPLSSATAVQRAVLRTRQGRIDQGHWLETIEESRVAFGRIAGVPASAVALGTAVSVHVGLIASSLPTGAEVLVSEHDFSALVNPFTLREDLTVRGVPLDALAAAVRPETALVAVSAVQSADGRIADLTAVREAALTCGARTLVDTTQSTGWLPLSAADYDYTVCGAYKWLMCPRGASFLTVRDVDTLRPLFASWLAGERPWQSLYGPVRKLTSSARRFDSSPAYLPYLGAGPALALVERMGVKATGDHNRELARRFRAGARGLGYEPVPGDSPIVSVPGLGHAEGRLREAGVEVAVRADYLRVSFHCYNTTADVDRLVAVLAAR